jgi:hypothetical protein
MRFLTSGIAATGLISLPLAACSSGSASPYGGGSSS